MRGMDKELWLDTTGGDDTPIYDDFLVGKRAYNTRTRQTGVVTCISRKEGEEDIYVFEPDGGIILLDFKRFFEFDWLLCYNEDVVISV